MSGDYKNYKPDRRLEHICDEAKQQDAEVLEAVCPSFLALSQHADRYQEPELIGCGGVKNVFRVYDRKMKRRIALARLREDRGLQFYELFVHEAQLVASMSHPNIIKVYDAAVDESGRPFFTMALKGESNLGGLLAGEHPPGQVALLEILLKVCDAIAYAHAAGVVHLDLKPENIQCDRFGEVVVCDWGLGRYLKNAGVEEYPQLLSLRTVEDVTLVGQIQGSLGYMAPEQVVPARDKDERTDIYALGCLLHTILCGEPPFSGTKDEVLDATVHCAVRPLRARYPERQIPESLEAVVLKAAAKNPDDRYATVEAFQQEILNYLGGYSTAAEQSGFFKEAALFLARNRIASSVVLAAIVALTVLSVLFVQQLGEERLATQEERNRAEHLLEEVDLITADYQSLAEQADVSRKVLAEKLAMAANKLKRTSLLLHPISTAEQVNRLVDMAMELDPACATARLERFMLHCMALNYVDALKDTEHSRSAVLELARMFSGYHFGLDSRPSSAQLIAVLQQAEAKRWRLAGNMEVMYAYHDDIARQRPGRVAEAEALLAFYNGGKDHFSLSYHASSEYLQLTCDQEEFYLWPKRARFGYSLLRFIPANKVKLVVSGQAFLCELGRLPLRVLDVSECPNLLIDRRVPLPNLTTLYVRKGQFPEGSLRHFIKADGDFEIIELDPGSFLSNGGY